MWSVSRSRDESRCSPCLARLAVDSACATGRFRPFGLQGVPRFSAQRLPSSERSPAPFATHEQYVAGNYAAGQSLLRRTQLDIKHWLALRIEQLGQGGDERVSPTETHTLCCDKGPLHQVVELEQFLIRLSAAHSSKACGELVGFLRIDVEFWMEHSGWKQRLRWFDHCRLELQQMLR